MAAYPIITMDGPGGYYTLVNQVFDVIKFSVYNLYIYQLTWGSK